MLQKTLFLCLSILLAFPLSIHTTTGQETILADADSGVQYTVERHLYANFPVAMVFTKDGRMFYTEKLTGNVRLVHADGTIQEEPVIHLPTSALQERGMLGIALDPDYENNGLIWVMHTAEGDIRNYPANNVVRFHEENGVGSDPETLLSVPIETGELLHNGGNVHFDKNGYLWVSIGDYGYAPFAQDITVPQGKIHRFEVTEDGLIPAPGNPFAGSSIYAYGLRNPFDFTFDSLSNNVYATENGPNCDDEVNLIVRGFNYGWDEDYDCVGMDFISGLTLYMPPMLTYTPTEAPTGIVVYDHPAIPEWQGNLLFCSWNFGTLRRVELDDTRTKVDSVHEIDLGGVPCRLDLVIGPEGAIYFGTVNEEDGAAIYRLLPQKE